MAPGTMFDGGTGPYGRTVGRGAVGLEDDSAALGGRKPGHLAAPQRVLLGDGVQRVGLAAGPRVAFSRAGHRYRPCARIAVREVGADEERQGDQQHRYDPARARPPQPFPHSLSHEFRPWSG